MTFTANDTIWFLQFVSPNNRNLQRSDGSYTLGVTDDNVKTVFIADNLSDYMTDKVLCHELCHVYSFSNNLDIPIEAEEMIADFMSRYGREIIYLADNIIENLLRSVA